MRVKVPSIWAICFVSGIITLIGGCRHGIEIIGAGNVTSESTLRDCRQSQSPCRFEIEGAYDEVYTAVPEPGWIHDAWERCQTPVANQCRFDISADVVTDFSGAEIPGAVARFRRPIEPLFRDGSDRFVTPEGNAGTQLRWLLNELPKSQTTIEEIRARFSSDFLQSIPANEIQQAIDNLRASVPDPEISDLIIATPIRVSVIIHNRGSSETGFSVALGAGYTEDAQITSFAIRAGFPRNGTNVRSEDRELNFAQLDEILQGLADKTSMYVARIENDQCQAIYQRNSSEPLLIASIYKLWILGALGREIEAGNINPEERLPLAGKDVVNAGAPINSEDLGTQLSIRDLANLMIGLSDNTATDHVARRVGRENLEQTLQVFGHSNRDRMLPFLRANELRNLHFSIPPETARDYLNGSNSQQRSILVNEIVPLGPFITGDFNNLLFSINAAWSASGQDVCKAYAGLRRFDNRSAEFDLVANAAGASSVFLGTRNRWDRVWQKGGSHSAGTGDRFVLTLSWLLESDSKGAFVVVLMANNENLRTIEDSSRMFSLAARAERLLAERF